MDNWIVLVLMAFFTHAGFAKTFVHGAVWPVKERNMAELLQERAAQLNTQEIQEQWQNRARQYYDRPGGVALPRTLKSSRHEYVPIAHAYQDIKDNEGNLIAQAGTSINVLQRLPFYHPELYFFNADDKAQMDYAKHIKVTSNTKLILVAGSIMDAQKALNQKVYFDQGGKLSSTFGIKQVPAHVTRQGDGLQVHEIEIKGARA
jgi:conjugal transfer pilus assembly protein TraW